MKIIGPQPTDLTWEERNPSEYTYRPLDVSPAKDKLSGLPPEPTTEPPLLERERAEEEGKQNR